MRTVIAIVLYRFSTVMLAAGERYLHFMGLSDALVRAREHACLFRLITKPTTIAGSITSLHLLPAQRHRRSQHHNNHHQHKMRQEMEGRFGIALRNRNDTTMPISSTVAILAVFVGRLGRWVDLTVCNACNWVVLRLMQTLGLPRWPSVIRAAATAATA
jgi:hypothetical protein